MWSMERTSARAATLIAGVLLSLAASQRSYATSCIVQPVKPIRHRCGIVKDESGTPIPKARVAVLKDGRGRGAVKTGADGAFSFEQLEAGVYEVSVEADGFPRAQSSIVISRPTKKCKRGLQVLLAVAGRCPTISRSGR